MNIKHPKILFTVLLFIVAFTSQAQNYQDLYWYFGQSNKGIRFDKGDGMANQADDHPAFAGRGGAAVATDSYSGNLLFYSDGNTVYNANHVPMPSGVGLTANPDANQPVVLARNPAVGLDNEFYIITNNASNAAAGTLRWGIVDMDQSGGAPAFTPAWGDVTTTNQSITWDDDNDGGTTPEVSFDVAAEAMIVIQNDNCSGYYLLAQVRGSNTYVVWNIDNTGIVYYDQFDLGAALNAANFSYNAARLSIAVSPSDQLKNIQIITMDPVTGDLAFSEAILNSGNSDFVNEAIYDTEWSHDGQYLYVSKHGNGVNTGDVLQYDMDNPGSFLTSVLPATVQRSYGLQIAPDSAIYHVYFDGNYRVGKIEAIDQAVPGTQYRAVGFTNPTIDGHQFPAFDPGLVYFIPDFTHDPVSCQNNPIGFYPELQEAADSILWSFGTPVEGNSNAYSPIFTFTQSGTQEVTMTAFYGGKPMPPVVKTIDLTPFDLQISGIQDEELCPEDLEAGHTMTASVSGTPSGTVVYKWGHEAANGESTTVTEPGVYYVVATDATGCSAYQSVTITEYKGTEQRANFWYFGNNAGINFNLTDKTDPSSPIVGPVTGAMVAPEGVATISNQNGDLILYTDGVTVYDKNDAPLALTLGGDVNATQSVLIVPVPGDETLYYIFTTQDVYGTGIGSYDLMYAIFDVKMNNGDGGLLKGSELLKSGITERLMGTGNSIIVHEFGSNTFVGFEITAQGVQGPEYSSEGSIHSNFTENSAQGYMKLSASNRLGVVLNDGSTNLLEVFDYIDSTRTVEEFNQVDLGNAGLQIYGLEFGGNNKIFVTLRNPAGGGPSKIIEVQMETDPLDLLNPTRITGLTILQEIDYAGDLGAIQYAPNGQMLVAINGSGSLGEITLNDGLGLLSSFNENGFDLGGNTSALGLPNFIQSLGTPPQESAIVFADNCLGSPTIFNISIPNVLETYTWDFGDGTTGTGETVTHTYAAAGTYLVSVVVEACAGPIVTLPTPVQVTIFPPPVDPNVTDDSENPGTMLLEPNQFLCSTPLTLKAQDITADPTGTNFIYLWSTGETTRTIDVNVVGTYSVSITSLEGCPTIAQTIITDGRPIADLGPDQFICQNETGPVLDAFNASANPGDITYAWVVRNASNAIVNTANASSLQVDTSTPGTFSYEVSVTNNLTTCLISDVVVFQVNPVATTANLVVNNTSCGTSNGSFSVDVSTGAGESDFTVVGSSGTVAQGTIPSNSVNFGVGATLLAIDAYLLTITNNVTGCTTTETINISGLDGPLFTATLNCDVIDLVYAGGTSIGPMSFEVYENGDPTNTITTTRLSDNQIQLDDNSQIVGLSAIDVKVTDSQIPTCDAFFTITLVAPPSIGSHEVLYPDCAGQSSASVNLLNVVDPGGSTYTWSTTTGTVFTASPTVSADVEPGHDYTVRMENAGICIDYIFNVADYVTFTPAFTPGGTECDISRTLVADVGALSIGDFTFTWFDNGAIIGAGPTLTITTTGDYKVSAMHNVTGCTLETPEQNVVLFPPFTIDVSNTPACNDGSDFTIMATVFSTNMGAITYQWFNGTTELDGATSSSLVRNEPGDYSVEVSYGGSCSQTVSANLVLAEPTPSELDADYVFCFEDTEELKEINPGNFVAATWFDENNNVVSTDVVFTPDEPGEYTVVLVNANGCITRDGILVRDECIPVVEAPNAFRPSSMISANQQFNVFTRFIDEENFEVFIFDRWGAMIFHSDDPDFRWNGGYENNEGKMLPVGTYVYLVKYISAYHPEEGTKEKRGGVSLLR